MRAWLGWVAAALLIALACTGGPDALDTSPPPASAAPAAPAQVAAGEIAGERDSQVRDDGLEIRHQIADRAALGHLRMAALPPSSQTAAPAPVRGALQTAPDSAPATVVDDGGRPHLGACSPETLQIFRC